MDWTIVSNNFPGDVPEMLGHTFCVTRVVGVAFPEAFRIHDVELLNVATVAAHVQVNRVASRILPHFRIVAVIFRKWDRLELYYQLYIFGIT